MRDLVEQWWGQATVLYCDTMRKLFTSSLLKLWRLCA